MAYRLATERIALKVDEDLGVEVERVQSWAVQEIARGRAAAFVKSQSVTALRDLYEFFVSEAQPTWDLLDHRGPVPPTTGGMLRLPLPFGLALVEAWVQSLPEPEAEESTAADEVLPPGPLRDQINAELKSQRRRARPSQTKSV